MGISLNQITEGAVAWHGTVDANWTTLESQFVAQQKAESTVVTVSGTTSETVLMSTTSIPANALAVGTVIPNWAGGSVTIPASTTPNVTWRLRWGGISGTVLSAFTWTFTSSGSEYTLPWFWDFRIVGVSTGASGSARVDGWLGLWTNFTSWNEGTITLDTTTAKDLVWTVQPSLSSVSVSQRSMTTDRG
jgi:hypothetical protein